MEQKEFRMEEVRLQLGGTYATVARAKLGSVRATFEVDRRKRRERTGWKRELKHHMKTLEMLSDETRRAVADFCRALAAQLGSEK